MCFDSTYSLRSSDLVKDGTPMVIPSRPFQEDLFLQFAIGRIPI